MNWLASTWAWIKTEPIVITQILAALIGLAAAFGFQLSATQTTEIMGMGQLIAAIIGRQLTTPNPKVAGLVQTALQTDAPNVKSPAVVTLEGAPAPVERP